MSHGEEGNGGEGRDCRQGVQRGHKLTIQFTYINGAFAPAPDDPVMNLYKCFGTEGHLIVNYRWVV